MSSLSVISQVSPPTSTIGFGVWKICQDTLNGKDWERKKYLEICDRKAFQSLWGCVEGNHTASKEIRRSILNYGFLISYEVNKSKPIVNRGAGEKILSKKKKQKHNVIYEKLNHDKCTTFLITKRQQAN